MNRALTPFTAALLFTAACATTPPVPALPDSQPPLPVTSRGFEPSASPARLPAPPLIRVGLLTDESNVVFPRIDGGYYLVTDAGTLFTRRGFEASAPMAGAVVRHGVQVGAISDLSSAEGVKARIERETGADVVLVFDAASGLHRVIAGSFATVDEARPFRQQLIDAGWASDSMIVPRPTGAEFASEITLVDDEGASAEVMGESVLVVPVSADEIRIGGSPYRGAARLFINSRGLLNIINELNVEHYVQGVIPNEMGPRQYDELEALKAQALAARTYGIKRLGDYRSEGYDICPTPACQVYRGKSTEHELTNRAVAETAGQVITWHGQPIDALYSATCGGETSDVGVMFPGRSEPYLRHASCVELETSVIRGVDNGPLADLVTTRARVFSKLAGYETGGSWAAGDVARALRSAMKYAGVDGDPGAPASSRRRDVYRWLYGTWNLEESAAHLLLPQDIEYFFPGRDPSAGEIVAAAWLVKFEFIPFQMIGDVDLDAAIPRDEMLSLLYSWLHHMKRVEEVRGRIRSVDGSSIRIKTDAGTVERTLSDGSLLFRSMGERYQELASVRTLPSDRITVIASGDDVAAVIVEANYDGAAFDRTSAYSGWVRSWSEPELVAAISRRNPIRDLEGLEIGPRDEAGRIIELVVRADGRSIPLKGLPIRWSLDVPDNLFTVQSSVDPDGVARWTFFGKGWGHGTGMCQVGAFGMAFRGHTAEEIIHNYYHDVEIVPLESLSGR